LTFSLQEESLLDATAGFLYDQQAPLDLTGNDLFSPLPQPLSLRRSAFFDDLSAFPLHSTHTTTATIQEDVVCARGAWLLRSPNQELRFRYSLSRRSSVALLSAGCGRRRRPKPATKPSSAAPRRGEQAGRARVQRSPAASHTQGPAKEDRIAPSEGQALQKLYAALKNSHSRQGAPFSRHLRRRQRPRQPPPRLQSVRE